MNVEFFKEFGRTNPTLPLTDAGNIVQGNACRLDWEEVCPKNESDEIYILGNPPYLGSRNQDKEQKEDMKFVLLDVKNFKKLDYIASWFYLGAKYIKETKRTQVHISFGVYSTCKRDGSGSNRGGEQSVNVSCFQ